MLKMSALGLTLDDCDLITFKEVAAEMKEKAIQVDCI